MKKALIVASVASMIDQFNMPNIALLTELGYKVEVACNFLEGSTCSDERIAKLRARLDDMGVPNHHVDISRRVTDLSRNLGAYKTLKKLIDDGGFDLIHCHSPIGGLICRLAGRAARRRGTVMMYTAHGFHFYRGAPKKNWLLYYPIEKFCSRMTDVLLTINGEDFEYAERKMKAKRNVYIPGVGIDLGRFAVQATADAIVAKRAEIGVPEDAFLLISVGELNVNKNHEVILRALSQIGDEKIHYAMVGRGDLEEYHRGLISELGLEEKVHMLGFREDVAELYAAADVCMFPSIREGLGVAAIEGLAAGLPLIAADNRGTRDYAIVGKGAYVCRHDDVSSFAEAIKSAKSSSDLKAMGEFNREYVKKYDVAHVMEMMREIYGNGGVESKNGK